jgi:hypothetical protein
MLNVVVLSLVMLNVVVLSVVMLNVVVLSVVMLNVVAPCLWYNHLLFSEQIHLFNFTKLFLNMLWNLGPML